MNWWVLCAGQGMLILYFMFLYIGLKASESVVYTFYISHTDSLYSEYTIASTKLQF